MNTSDDLDLLLEKYNGYLRHERRLAKNTVITYGRMLAEYLAFVKSGAMRSFLAPLPEELQSFIAGLRDRRGPLSPAAPRTIALNIDTLRPFYRWLVLHGHTTQTAIRHVLNLQKPRANQDLEFVMSREQIAKLLDAPQRGRYRERDKAILETFYSTGCRVSELASMRMGDVDLNAGKVRCTVKGGSEKFLFLGRYAVAAILLYLAGNRPQLARKKPNAPWLFLHCNTSEGHMVRQTLFRMVRKYGKQIGIENEVSPHTIRRSAATHLLAGGADLRSVMEFLGHKSVRVTQRYLGLDPSHLKKTHENYHPHGVHGRAPKASEMTSRPLADSVRWPDVQTEATTPQKQ